MKTKYVFYKDHKIDKKGRQVTNIRNKRGDVATYTTEIKRWDFPGGAVVKNPPANAGDTGLIPGPGRSHMPWSN